MHCAVWCGAVLWHLVSASLYIIGCRGYLTLFISRGIGGVQDNATEVVIEEAQGQATSRAFTAEVSLNMFTLSNLSSTAMELMISMYTVRREIVVG